ncbi:MAG: N-6 DNA methylase, partial [Proteobacteria bacterium]|nr:N-6 DNA methylase [Pseudomonadota bacterium]
MSQAAFADTAECYRVDAVLKLDPGRRSDLGQYMTPAPIARFMVSLFADVSGDIRLLDPGAGVGSLTAAFVERICAGTAKPRSLSLLAYEIEPVLSAYLRNTLDEAVGQCRLTQIKASSALHEEDFILGHSWGAQPDIFGRGNGDDSGFSHVILNPPYKKINSASAHRAALRKAGIETSNLYTAFMFLAAQRLLETVDVPVPDGIVEAEVHSHLEGENRLEDDEHRAEVDESTRKALKAQFLLDAIAEKLEVKVEQPELIEYLIMSAQQYGMDPNQFAQAIDQQGQIPSMVQEV